jgi:putative DNA primase/helicase
MATKEKLGLPAYDASRGFAPIHTLRATVALGKSQMFRDKAARFLNRTTLEGCVVIAVDRHDLGVEQVEKFYDEHPNTALVARIWRGRGAVDPEQTQPEDPSKPRLLMCLRNKDAEEVGKHGLSVEKCLCRHVDRETEEETLCPHYSEDAEMPCGYQRQQRQHANIWFCAHETLLHEIPAIFGTVLFLFIDEDPLDAFLFGLDVAEQKQFALVLDALTEVPHNIEDEYERGKLEQGRRQLHKILARLRAGPVPVNALREFYKEKTDELLRFEWKNKIADVDIRPDMDSATISKQLAVVAGNRDIKVRKMLWKLIGEAEDTPILVNGVEVWPRAGEHQKHDLISGRIEIVRDKEKGRMIRMKGVKTISGGCHNVPTLIGSATLDHELLLPIFKTAKEYPPRKVRKPKHVVVRQVIDKSFSKSWIAPEDDEQTTLERACDVYAMVLREASKFAPLRSLMVVHLATEHAIRQHCFVPDWIELAHHGAITGLDRWKTVRAAFIVGRPMPSAFDITLQAEALSGEYISAREYVEREVAIPIVPDADGNNEVYVKQYQHPHPMAERLRKRMVEGGLTQAIGRTRYILRTAADPLDIWLLNDVPMGHELGAVVAVEEAEIAPSLDDLMSTTGIWLENAADAARAFPTLIVSEAALRKDRSRRSVTFPYNIVPYRRMSHSSPKTTTTTITYRRVGKGAKNAQAIFLAGATDDPKQWLTNKLGPLAYCEVGS